MGFGVRQQQILEALAQGGCSYEALLRQVDAGRGQFRDSLKRLETLGLIKVLGRRGNDPTAAWVELSGTVVVELADGLAPKPKRDPLAQHLWSTPKRPNRLQPEC
jgi:hypothetical protein